MRIKVIRKPTELRIDGIRLNRFRPGLHYDVGNSLGALFLAEGWAIPAADDATPVEPSTDLEGSDWPPNLLRETFPPMLAQIQSAGDRRPKPRKRRS